MASQLMEALQALAHEKKIDEFYLIERLEASLAKSYQNILDLEWDARVTIDRTTGKIYVYELVPVGEPDEETGEYAEFEERDVTPEGVSRIAAQNAKGVIAAMVREAGRQSIYEEFSDRVGDIVTATVLQATPDFTIVKIRDGVEAELSGVESEVGRSATQFFAVGKDVPKSLAEAHYIFIVRCHIGSCYCVIVVSLEEYS